VAASFDGDFLRRETKTTQFFIQKVSDGPFISGEGFNIHQLTREPDHIHGTRINHDVLLAA
jgi:hypothetical protein